jgi:hypothetical protein
MFLDVYRDRLVAPTLNKKCLNYGGRLAGKNDIIRWQANRMPPNQKSKHNSIKTLVLPSQALGDSRVSCHCKIMVLNDTQNVNIQLA